MPKLIFGAFSDRKEVNDTIMELDEAGVATEDFSIITQGQTTDGSSSEQLKASDGLAGLIANAIATAGMFVVGPIAILTGLGWMVLSAPPSDTINAVAGGLAGALVALGISRETAERQESIVKDGGVLLGVEDRKVSEQEVQNCFENHDSKQIVVIEHVSIPVRIAAVLP